MENLLRGGKNSLLFIINYYLLLINFGKKFVWNFGTVFFTWVLSLGTEFSPPFLKESSISLAINKNISQKFLWGFTPNLSKPRGDRIFTLFLSSGTEFSQKEFFQLWYGEVIIEQFEKRGVAFQSHIALTSLFSLHFDLRIFGHLRSSQNFTEWGVKIVNSSIIIDSPS